MSPEFADSMYLLIVGSLYCVMRFAYALRMRRQNHIRFPCVYIEPFELVFADSRIALLCHSLRICVAHAPPESCPFSLLVH